jgi:hypothetical protein
MKRYRHIGTQPLELGSRGEGHPEPKVVEPGQAFVADLDPAHEAFLVRVGAIAVDADVQD